jgi:hypothetical protein
MVLRMNMSAGSAGGEWRIVNRWITIPAKRDQTVTIIRGVPTPDDGTVTGGTTVPHRHPLQRKCGKTIEERGPSVGMMPWHLMLENTRVVAETEHSSIYKRSIGRLGILRSLWAGSEKHGRRMDLLAHTGSDFYIYPLSIAIAGMDHLRMGGQNLKLPPFISILEFLTSVVQCPSEPVSMCSCHFVTPQYR